MASEHYVNHNEKANHLLLPVPVQLLVYLKQTENTESTSFLSTGDMTFLAPHSLLRESVLSLLKKKSL